jgi:hypothetical protein
VRWTLITVTIISYQTLGAPKSLTDKGLRKGLYMSILRRKTTALVSAKVLFCSTILYGGLTYPMPS